MWTSLFVVSRYELSFFGGLRLCDHQFFFYYYWKCVYFKISRLLLSRLKCAHLQNTILNLYSMSLKVFSEVSPSLFYIYSVTLEIKRTIQVLKIHFLKHFQVIKNRNHAVGWMHSALKYYCSRNFRNSAQNHSKYDTRKKYLTLANA